MKTYEFLLKKTLKWKKRGLVLAAHGVSETPIDSFLDNVHMTKDNFIIVLDLLERLNFEFVDYSKMRSFVLGLSKPKKHWVHITLDDGYKNNLDVALSLLKNRNIPFTVFVSTFHIENQIPAPSFYTRFLYRLKKPLSEIFLKNFESYDEFEKYFLQETTLPEFDNLIKKMTDMMSEKDLKAFRSYKNAQFLSVQNLKDLSEQVGVTIASHSHHHVTFHALQSERDQIIEIQTSFEKLKQWNIPYVNSFCFPNGDYSQTTLDVLNALHVELAFASFPGIVNVNTLPLEIPRFWFGIYKKMLVIFTFVCLGRKFINLYVKYKGLGPKSM
ncbi:MAG: polysaccharide deacetylase family protein [Bdellovibrionaceae bacterium]|nr:polysaccharide deacetylase family protein [Pseudobdellovibrionaceae bacterium]